MSGGFPAAGRIDQCPKIPKLRMSVQPVSFTGLVARGCNTNCTSFWGSVLPHTSSISKHGHLFWGWSFWAIPKWRFSPFRWDIFEKPWRLIQPSYPTHCERLGPHRWGPSSLSHQRWDKVLEEWRKTFMARGRKPMIQARCERRLSTASI